MQLEEPRALEFARAAGDWLWELDDQYRFVVDTEPGTGRDVGGPSYFGLKRWELPGVDAQDPIWARHKADLAANRPIRDFVYSFRAPDGRRRHVRVNGNPFFAPDGRFLGYRGTAHDITEQVAAQAAHEAAIERLQMALDAAEVGMFDWNVATGEAVFDRHWAAILGYRVDELRPHVDTWRELVHPDDIGSVMERLDAHLRGETPVQDVEFRMRAKSGEWRWILARGKVVQRDAEGRPLRMTGTHIDVTKRKLAELALEESERRYRTLIAAMAEGIVFQGRDGRIIACNPRAEAILGLSAAQIEGRDSLDPRWRAVREDGTPFPGDAHPAMVTLRTGQPCRAVLMGVHRPDGTLRWISINTEPLFDAGDSRPSAVVSSFADITERREAEARLRAMQRREAVGQLTAGIAHDFNNLLAVISGHLELLQEQVDALAHGADSETLRAALDERRLQVPLAWALQASRRGADLIQRLLAFARGQALRPESIGVNRLIAEMAAMLPRVLGEAIAVRTVLDPGLKRGCVDRGQLENAVLNLAINARDAMPMGGELVIETANLHVGEGGAVDIDGKVDPGDYVMLTMRDTGLGMTPEIAAHAFEPFFTTKEAGRGSGLGLSMVYGFVKQSGGCIEISSEVGSGTTIRFCLPTAEADA